MNVFDDERREEPAKILVPPQDFEQVANEICEQAFSDAKEKLHPLMRNSELQRLRKRKEFVQAFKLALEERIAETLAVWQPNIQAVFKFDESWIESYKIWDGSIHLLVIVPRVSDAIKTIGRKLDQNLTYRLKQSGWTRFQKHRSILEVQQVTPNELRHGTSYGAMFYAVYNLPVKVWSRGNR